MTVRAMRFFFCSASGGARGVVALMSGLAICACSPPTEQQAPSSSSRRQTASPHLALKLVRLPDLSAMSVPVQKQVRDRFELLTRTTEDAAARASDRADAHGELGKLLFAAESYEEAEPCFFNAHVLAPADARWSYYSAHIYRLQGESRKPRSSSSDTSSCGLMTFRRSSGWATRTSTRAAWTKRTRCFRRGLARQPDAAARFGRGRVALAKHDYSRCDPASGGRADTRSQRDSDPLFARHGVPCGGQHRAGRKSPAPARRHGGSVDRFLYTGLGRASAQRGRIRAAW